MPPLTKAELDAFFSKSALKGKDFSMHSGYIRNINRKSEPKYDPVDGSELLFKCIRPDPDRPDDTVNCHFCKESYRHQGSSSSVSLAELIKLHLLDCQKFIVLFRNSMAVSFLESIHGTIEKVYPIVVDSSVINDENNDDDDDDVKIIGEHKGSGIVSAISSPFIGAKQFSSISTSSLASNFTNLTTVPDHLCRQLNFSPGVKIFVNKITNRAIVSATSPPEGAGQYVEVASSITDLTVTAYHKQVPLRQNVATTPETATGAPSSATGLYTQAEAEAMAAAAVAAAAEKAAALLPKKGRKKNQKRAAPAAKIEPPKEVVVVEEPPTPDLDYFLSKYSNYNNTSDQEPTSSKRIKHPPHKSPIEWQEFFDQSQLKAQGVEASSSTLEQIVKVPEPPQQSQKLQLLNPKEKRSKLTTSIQQVTNQPTPLRRGPKFKGSTTSSNTVSFGDWGKVSPELAAILTKYPPSESVSSDFALVQEKANEGERLSSEQCHSFFSMKVIPYGPTFGICRLCINTVLSFQTKMSITQMNPKMVKHIRGEKHRGLFTLYMSHPGRFPLFNRSVTFDELMVAFCKLRAATAQKWLQKFGRSLEGGESLPPGKEEDEDGSEEEVMEIEEVKVVQEVKPALEETQSNSRGNFGSSTSSSGNHHVQVDQREGRIWTVL